MSFFTGAIAAVDQTVIQPSGNSLASAGSVVVDTAGDVGTGVVDTAGIVGGSLEGAFNDVTGFFEDTFNFLGDLGKKLLLGGIAVGGLYGFIKYKNLRR